MKIKQVTHNEYVGQVIIDTGLDTDTMYEIVETVLNFSVNGWEDIPGTTQYKFDVDLSMMDDWEPTDPEYQAEVKRIGQSIINILTDNIPRPVKTNQEIFDEYDLGEVIMDCVYSGMTCDQTLDAITDLLQSETSDTESTIDNFIGQFGYYC